jgi:hypothetical protein
VAVAEAPAVAVAVVAAAVVEAEAGSGDVLVGNTHAVGHTPHGRYDEVEPYRPTWYDGQNREEQTRPPQTLGGKCHK